MTTPLAPENQNPPTQPTPQDSAPSTKDNVISNDILAREFANLRATVEAQNKMIEELRSIPPPNVKQEDAPTSDDFFKDPNKHFEFFAKKINAEVRQAVAPIDNFRKKFETNDVLVSAKSKIKEQFGSNWTKIEPILDEWANGAIAKGQELNEILIAEAGVHILGNLALRNQLGGPASTPIPPTNSNSGNQQVSQNPLDPPFMRSSSPPAPTPAPNQTQREYTENEKKVMREFNLTPDKFDALQSARAVDVIHIDPATGKLKV